MGVWNFAERSGLLPKTNQKSELVCGRAAGFSIPNQLRSCHTPDQTCFMLPDSAVNAPSGPSFENKTWSASKLRENRMAKIAKRMSNVTPKLFTEFCFILFSTLGSARSRSYNDLRWQPNTN